jgi:hypothetical protein
MALEATAATQAIPRHRDRGPIEAWSEEQLLTRPRTALAPALHRIRSGGRRSCGVFATPALICTMAGPRASIRPSRYMPARVRRRRGATRSFPPRRKQHLATFLGSLAAPPANRCRGAEPPGSISKGAPCREATARAQGFLLVVTRLVSRTHLSVQPFFKEQCHVAMSCKVDGAGSDDRRDRRSVPP